MAQHRGPNPQDVEEESEEDENPFAPQPAQRRPANDESRRWETGLKVDIPEFHGGLQADEYLDWINAVDEVLDFKQVPEDRRVALVATRLRGRAGAWWQQVKKTRTIQGKGKITCWDKMKKHMHYTRTLYQRLQNLTQGSRSVDDYTTEFYELVSRDAIAEDKESRVARYIGGLRIQFQDVLNMFEILSVSDAHQRAVQLDRQLARRNTGITSFGGSGANTSNVSGRTGNISFGGGSTGGASSSNTRPAVPPSTFIKPTVPTHTTTPNTGFRCFNCGEPGHRFAECKKGPRRGLFSEMEEISREQDGDVETEAVCDEKERVEGDTGPMLMVRRSCLAPRGIEDDWLRTNVFQSTCTIGGKVCQFIIDLGSFKVVLLPKKEVTGGPLTGETSNLLTMAKFEAEIRESGVVYVLMGREKTEVNRSTKFSPFEIVYGFLPRCPLDLANLPSNSKVHHKAEDLITQLQDIHNLTRQNLLESVTKFKHDADRKRCMVDFQVGEFVWAVLTKDRFPAGEYNKLSARKIGPVEIIEKINSNAYRLKLPSHIHTAVVFNVKHLIPFRGDSSSEEDLPNSWSNSSQQGEDDADRIANTYLEHLMHPKQQSF
ncbi:hypothetical protein DKX38_028991 [Salix brachista]|uniref:CCHC-type domain-containing protein n=1 Tax=Salix brachista TaxID=2182728 RepID=A0A5N5J3U5_9ROSI|nr:hypothetical protein DKX38_028991 [Salix brachista]